MSKTYEFGDKICIVKDKVSAMIKAPDNEKKLVLYVEGFPNGVTIQHASKEERDKSYNMIMEDLNK